MGSTGDAWSIRKRIASKWRKIFVFVQSGSGFAVEIFSWNFPGAFNRPSWLRAFAVGRPTLRKSGWQLICLVVAETYQYPRHFQVDECLEQQQSKLALLGCKNELLLTPRKKGSAIQTHWPQWSDYDEACLLGEFRWVSQPNRAARCETIFVPKCVSSPQEMGC